MAGATDTPDPGASAESEQAAPAPTSPVTPETLQQPVGEALALEKPIPAPDHKRILETTRTKVREEAEREFRQQHEVALQTYAALEQDPGGSLARMIAAGMADPDLAPVIAKAAAQALAGRRGVGQPQAQEQEPQADLQLPDGTPLMSAQRLAEWREWNDRRLMAQLDEKLAPIQNREQKIAAQEKYDAQFKDAKGRMGQVLDRVKSRPHYAEHAKAINERIVSLMKEGVSAEQAPSLAYVEIVETVVLPAKASAAKQALVTQAVEQSKGSTAPPSAVMPSAQTRPRSLSEGMRQQGVSSL